MQALTGGSMERITDIINSAPKVISNHYYDATIQSGQLTQWEQLYDQLSPGPFIGSVRELRLDQLHLFCENTNTQLRQQCQVNKKSFWFGFSAGSQNYHLNETQISPYQLLVMRDHNPFELVTPEGFSIYSAVLEIDDNDPDSHFLMQILECIENDNQPLVNYQSPNKTRQLYNIRMYIEQLLQHNSHYTNSHIIQKLVTDAITHCLVSDHQDIKSPAKQIRRKKVIKNLKELVSEPDFPFPITITELCNQLHVSHRALQYACEEKLGCSPHHFLLATRLNKVKRMIADPENDKSITDIALSMGFFHYGLFSTHYKRLFGESPSCTVLRAKRLMT